MKKVDNGENNENEDGDEEGKFEESEKSSETKEGDTQLLNKNSMYTVLSSNSVVLTSSSSCTNTYGGYVASLSEARSLIKFASNYGGDNYCDAQNTYGIGWNECVALSNGYRCYLDLDDVSENYCSNDDNFFTNGSCSSCSRSFCIYTSTPTTYTVTYNTQGGNSIPSVQASSVTLPTPTRNGYTFKGWCKNATMCSSPIPAGTSETVIANVTYYAQWAQNYTVTYDTQGGNTISSVQASSVILPTPTRDGYTFIGWCKDSETCSSPISAGTSQTITADVTYYAQWEFYNYCPVGTIYYSEAGLCSQNIPTTSTDGLVYYWRDENGEDVISLINGDITMMNKNLGANMAGTGEDSYGNHYQWGNNYGFEQSLVSLDISSNPVAYENYRPGNRYKKSVFIKGGDDYWSGNTHYDNLWGGRGDSESNDFGGIKNGDVRQGPCPNGYHVPSMKEWETVLVYFAGKVGQNTSTSMYNNYFHYFSNSTNRSKFQEDFMLPFAGSRSSQGVSGKGNYGYYWSSTPYSTYYARYFFLDTSYVRANYNSASRNSAFSVRCFKDSPDAPATRTITFHENGGDLLGATGDDGEGTLIQKVANGTKAQQPVNPTGDGMTFQKWTTDQAGESEFNFSNTVTSSMDLYAQYGCTNGTHNENGACVSNTKKENCIAGNIANGQYTVEQVDVTWDTSTSGWNATPSCTKFTCNTNYHASGNACVSNTKKENCIAGSIANGQYTVEEVDVTWNTSTSGWNAIPSCTKFTCNTNYHASGNVCVSNTKKENCIAGTIANGQYTIEQVDVTWNTSTSGWNATPSCTKFTCNTNYHVEGTGCVVNTSTNGGSNTSSGGGGGGGGGGSKKSTESIEKITEDKEIAIVEEHNSADEEKNSDTDQETINQEIIGQEIEIEGGTQKIVKIEGAEIVATVRNTVSSNNSSYTKEQNEAYSFAKSNGITSTSSIEKAKMDKPLKRIEMAKMLSNYAINVLGVEPDASKGVVKFKDVTEEMDKKYDNAVTKAYQLGIMGQNTNGNMFRPNDEVTRAEFAAALSRLLYNTSDGEFRGTRKYYIPHITKLYNQGIIKTAIPGLKELRGYVMIMLMRTVK